MVSWVYGSIASLKIFTSPANEVFCADGIEAELLVAILFVPPQHPQPATPGIIGHVLSSETMQCYPTVRSWFDKITSIWCPWPLDVLLELILVETSPAPASVSVLRGGSKSKPRSHRQVDRTHKWRFSCAKLWNMASGPMFGLSHAGSLDIGAPDYGRPLLPQHGNTGLLHGGSNRQPTGLSSFPRKPYDRSKERRQTDTHSTHSSTLHKFCTANFVLRTSTQCDRFLPEAERAVTARAWQLIDGHQNVQAI